MKEVSIEQKAKRYDEGIKIAKSKIKNDKDHVLYEDDIIEIFPELEESEDERVRKWLICGMNALKEQKNETFATIPIDKVIAWLEKQRSVEEIVEKYKTSWYNEGKIHGKMEGLSDEEKYQQGWHDALEKQGEQKQEWTEEDERILKTIIINIENLQFSDEMREKYQRIPNTNKNYYQIMADWLKGLKDRIQSNQSNKPQGKSALEAINEETVDNSNKIVNAKFHKGDWIVVRGEVILICDIRNNLYDVMFADGEHRHYDTNILDKESRLWTIADAKDGDVLISWTNRPFIYNGFFSEGVVGAYCGLNTFNRIIIADKQDYLHNNWTINKDVRPATKKQRDILFQKIEDKGYEWNGEKKLLKK